jgi:hypothetical protein
MSPRKYQNNKPKMIAKSPRCGLFFRLGSSQHDIGVHGNSRHPIKTCIGYARTAAMRTKRLWRGVFNVSTATRLPTSKRAKSRHVVVGKIILICTCTFDLYLYPSKFWPGLMFGNFPILVAISVIILVTGLNTHA